MGLGFGRGGGTERETRGYEPFALHVPIHHAMLGVCDQEQGVMTRVLHDRAQERLLRRYRLVAFSIQEKRPTSSHPVST